MRSVFDAQAAAYDRWLATPLGRLVDEVEKQAIFSLTPEVQGRRILEVGCGTGNCSLALAHKRAQVVGLDCSYPMLARAQEKVSRQDLDLALVRGLASHLPFADESFDGVMCILAMDFMDRTGDSPSGDGEGAASRRVFIGGDVKSLQSLDGGAGHQVLV